MVNKVTFVGFRGAISPLDAPLARGSWAMVPKMYNVHNLPPILPILQKGCTTVSGVYLGFPAPGDRVGLGASIQPVRSRIDAKSELGVKWCRAPHIL